MREDIRSRGLCRYIATAAKMFRVEKEGERYRRCYMVTWHRGFRRDISTAAKAFWAENVGAGGATAQEGRVGHLKLWPGINSSRKQVSAL